jgi:hypothetical protein
MFDKPDNEWLTGLLYPYNKDQDQSRKEIKRLIDDSTFVKDEDYDDYGVSEIPTPVRYKHFSETRSFGEYTTNARKRTFKHLLQIRDEYHSYKYKDRFKLMEQADDEKPYEITNVEYPKNTYRTKAISLYPGLQDQYNSKALISLG